MADVFGVVSELLSTAPRYVRPRLPAWTGPVRAVARWRWPLWFAVVVAEAFWTTGESAADVSMFSARGAEILHGNLSAVYADSGNQAGPVQLLMCWLLLGGRSDADIPVWTLAAVNAGLLLLALLACRSRRPVGPPTAAREAAVGALVAVWLMPGGLWAGHPAEIAIPVLWAVAAASASRGRGLAAGGLIGLASAVAPWGILALPIVLLVPRRRAAGVAALGGIGVAVAAYLPFALTGRFRLLHHRWPVYPGSLIHAVAPGVEQFGWNLRVAQAVLAMGACALVAVRCHDKDRVWLVVLAPELMRVITDPVVGSYYWQPIGAAVIVGVAVRAPIVRLPHTWAALIALVYLPYLANLNGMWLITGSLCLVAMAILARQSRLERSAQVYDAAYDECMERPPRASRLVRPTGPRRQDDPSGRGTPGRGRGVGRDASQHGATTAGPPAPSLIPPGRAVHSLIPTAER